MTSLDQLKCSVCYTLPDSVEINFCANNHLVCGKCSIKFGGLCKCLLPLSRKVQNPLLVSISGITDKSPTEEKKPCRYKDLGCTWLFTDNELIDHLTECKFRIISCIGSTLGIWSCSWRGQQLAIGDHFQENHSDVGDFFSYFQESHIPFNEFITSGTLNLIDAFNKKFVFYFHSNAETKIAYFAIVLMGMKSDAENFSYEFTIKAPEENSRRKIKFVEDVYNTDFDIEMFLKAERCVALSHRTVKNHLHENNIHFRFVISKKDDMDRPLNKLLSQTSLDTAKNKPAAKVPNKSGKMTPHRRSGGASIPTGGGGGGGAAVVSAPRTIPAINPGQLADHSSINRLKVREGICQIPGVIDTPCFMPSINKSLTLDQQIAAKNGKTYIDSRISAADATHPASSVIKTNTPQPGYKQQTTKQYGMAGVRQDGHLNVNSKYKLNK